MTPNSHIPLDSPSALPTSAGKTAFAGRVCAIIPTYNRMTLLPAALDSVLRQTRPVDEIIVVNDGSTDGTLKALEPYGDRIRVVTQTNGGKAAAMNLGLSHATADYIWFFDDDDVAADDGIAPLVAAMDADPTLTMAYGMHLKFMDGHQSETFTRPFWALPEQDRPIIDFLGNLFPFQAAMLVRRTAFDAIGNFDTSFARSEDVEAFIRLALHGKAAYVPHTVFYQRGHGGSRGPSSQSMSGADALSRAVDFDQKAILRHRDKLTLDQVMPKYATGLAAPLQQRAATFQRASIFARFALWKDAVADLKAAAKCSDRDALPQELAWAAVTVTKDQMWDRLILDRDSIAGLRELSASTRYGHQIVAALLTTLPWHIRASLAAGDYGRSWQRLGLMKSILGTGGIFALFFARLTKKLSGGRG